MQLQYISSTLDDNATLIADWQTTVTNYNAQNAALWKVGQVAAAVSGHQSSDITNVLLDTAVGSGFSSTDALAMVSDKTVPGFTGDASFTNLTAPNNTATNVKTQLLTYIGLSTAEYDNGTAIPTAPISPLLNSMPVLPAMILLQEVRTPVRFQTMTGRSCRHLTAAVIDNSTRA